MPPRQQVTTFGISKSAFAIYFKLAAVNHNTPITTAAPQFEALDHVLDTLDVPDLLDAFATIDGGVVLVTGAEGLVPSLTALAQVPFPFVVGVDYGNVSKVRSVWVGAAINRAARLAATPEYGQVLLSEGAREKGSLTRIAPREGTHRVKDGGVTFHYLEPSALAASTKAVATMLPGTPREVKRVTLVAVDIVHFSRQAPAQQEASVSECLMAIEKLATGQQYVPTGDGGLLVFRSDTERDVEPFVRGLATGTQRLHLGVAAGEVAWREKMNFYFGPALLRASIYAGDSVPGEVTVDNSVAPLFMHAGWKSNEPRPDGSWQLSLPSRPALAPPAPPPPRLMVLLGLALVLGVPVAALYGYLSWSWRDARVAVRTSAPATLAAATTELGRRPLTPEAVSPPPQPAGDEARATPVAELPVSASSPPLSTSRPPATAAARPPLGGVSRPPSATPTTASVPVTYTGATPQERLRSQDIFRRLLQGAWGYCQGGDPRSAAKALHDNLEQASLTDDDRRKLRETELAIESRGCEALAEGGN